MLIPRQRQNLSTSTRRMARMFHVKHGGWRFASVGDPGAGLGGGAWVIAMP